MYVHVLLVIVYMYGGFACGKGRGKDSCNKLCVSFNFFTFIHSLFNFNFTIHKSHLNKNVVFLHRAAQSEGW